MRWKPGRRVEGKMESRATDGDGPAHGRAMRHAAVRLERLALHLRRRERLERSGGSGGRPKGQLGPSPSSALTVVVEGGALRVGRLAALEQVSESAMSRTVSALEVHGLVRRGAPAGDGRSRLVEATEEGSTRIRHWRAEAGSTFLSRGLAGLPTGRKLIVVRAIELLERLVLPGGHPHRPP